MAQPIHPNESARIEPRLVRQRTPRISDREPALEVFETRLALSANPGSQLVAEAFASLDVVQSHLDQCFPASTNDRVAPEIYNGNQLAADFQPLTGDPGAGLNQGSTLFDQAATLRRDFNLTGAGQTVAVIDSGIAWDHVALGSGFGPGYRVVGGWDFAENDADPYDDAPAGFHGTHVSGLIAGNSDSLQGIAPGADLVGLRVFDDFGRSSLDWIESALQWVYANRNTFEFPITTVNLSLGAMLPDQLAPDVQLQLDDELQQLRDGGIIVVAAAGNSFSGAHPDRLNYPASSINAWAIASGDENGLSLFSQRESSILAAPGERLISSVPDHLLGRDGIVNDYHAATGTSMSAPQVAAASVLVREALIQVGGDFSPPSILQILQDTSSRQIDSVTGQNYFAIDLGAAITSVLGNASDEGSGGGSDVGFQAPTDIGIVAWDRVELEPQEGVRAIAARDGLFSIRPDERAADTILRVTDTEGRELWRATVPSTGQIDIPVVSGQALVIHSAGGDSDSPVASLQLANVIQLDGRELTLVSGPADPPVSIDLRNGLAASIGSFAYQFGPGQVATALLDGGSGADQLNLQGSEATARLTLNPYSDGTLSEGNLQLVLRGFEDVRYDGGGGADRAFLYDTRGDDILTSRPGYAMLQGVGFTYEVSGIERSYVHATAGGQDVAFLHDSNGDEELAVRPQFVSLRGNGFFNSANGFEKVYAYSTGGRDTADLYDSAGDDRMSASATSALITGPGYFVQAREFDIVTGYATAGGNDLATLYSDNPATDRWIRTSDQLTLKAGNDAERIARGFETVRAFQGGAEFNPTSMLEELHRREREILNDLFAAL